MTGTANTANRQARRHPETVQADELAARLGVSTWALYESVRRGDCPVTPIKVGRRLVWPKAVVDQLLGLNDEGRGANPGPASTSPASTSPTAPITERKEHPHAPP